MTSKLYEPATMDDIATMSEQLGRPVRDVVGVGARTRSGEPTVIVTAPMLRDGTPFPTLYYLCHPGAVAAMSRLESVGVMGEFTQLLEESADLRQAYRRAHEAYLNDRNSIRWVEEVHDVSAGGMPTRVKCLHALAAHSLAAGPGVNPIGDIALERSMWKP